MKKLLKYLEGNILSLSIICLLIFIPLYPKFPLFNIPGIYVAVRIEDFLVTLILGIWLLLESRQGWPTFKEKTSRLIGLYFLTGATSLLSALLITKIILPHIAIFHYLRRIEYMSLFFVAFASIKRKENLKSFVHALFLTIVGVFVFGVGQKYLGWPVISTMNEEFSKGTILRLTKWTRISATFGGHYDLAAFTVLVLMLFLGFIIGVKEIFSKILSLIFISLAFYLLLLTASRVSFIAYLIGATTVLVLAQKKKWIIPVISLSLLTMVLSSELGQRYAATFKLDLSFLSAKIPQKRELALTPSTLTPTLAPVLRPGIPQEKVPVLPVEPAEKEATEEAVPASAFPSPEPIEIAIQRSGEIRFKVEWPRAARAFLKNPLLGTGYSSVTLATDNDYLRTLAETGILGFGAMFLIFLQMAKEFVLFFKNVKLNFEKAIVIGISGAMVGFLANALFIDVFEASKVAFIFWMLAGIMMGTIKNQRLKMKD